MRIRAQLARHWPTLTYAAIALIITAPWFINDGVLLLLDYMQAPHAYLPPLSHAKSIPEWIVKILLALPTFIIPAHIVQKMYLTGILFLCGVSMYVAMRTLLPKAPLIAPAALLAGTIYTLNPLVITRLAMGQHLFLLAYSITPLAIAAWIAYTKHSSRTLALVAGIAIAAVFTANIHHIFLLPILIATFTFYIPKQRRLIPLLAPSLAVIFLVALSPSDARELDPRGPLAFAPQPHISSSIWTDALMGSAMWNAPIPFEHLPHHNIAAYGLFIAISFLVLMGYLALARAHPHRAIRVGVCGVIAVFLAIGMSHPVSRPLAAWMYEHVPHWIGLRDSAKFLALSIFIISFLAGYAMITLQTVKEYTSRICTLVATISIGLAIPVSTSMHSIIQPEPYPETWHAWHEQKRTESILILPWHQYLSFSFTQDRIVVNPAPVFFTHHTVISGDNMDAILPDGSDVIHSDRPTTLSTQIADTIHTCMQNTNACALDRMLAQKQIPYVALLRDAKTASIYNWLYDQENLVIVFNTPSLTVWSIYDDTN